MKITVKSYWKREDGYVGTATAIILAAVAAVTAASSAAYAGYSQKKAADYNADVANNNAKMAQLQASADAALIQKRNQRLQGSQLAAMSAAGLDVDSSSATDVMYDSKVAGELDRLTTLYKGKVASTNYNAQAAGYRQEGKNALAAGYMNAGSSLIGGAANMASMSAGANSSGPSFDGGQASSYAHPNSEFNW